VYVLAHSPPHLCVEVFLHHVVERQPHPVPSPVEHVVTSSHEPAAEYAQLGGDRGGGRRKVRSGMEREKDEQVKEENGRMEKMLKTVTKDGERERGRK